MTKLSLKSAKRAILGVALASVAMVSACASSPNAIQGTYTSPLLYSNYDCQQIQGELIRLQTRVNIIAGEQSKKARSDKIAAGVGAVVFWPALFLLASDDNKAELSNLKGQYDALEQVAVVKRCSVGGA